MGSLVGDRLWVSVGVETLRKDWNVDGLEVVLGVDRSAWVVGRLAAWLALGVGVLELVWGLGRLGVLQVVALGVGNLGEGWVVGKLLVSLFLVLGLGALSVGVDSPVQGVGVLALVLGIDIPAWGVGGV